MSDKISIDLCRAYRQAFTTEAGKRVLEDLLKAYPPDRSPFDCNGAWSSDPVAAAFRSGQSSVTKAISDACKAGELIPQKTP